jgi:hypothetical protein
VAQMVDRATKPRRLRRPRHVRVHTWLVAAALVFVGAVACAFWAAAPGAGRRKTDSTSESSEPKAKPRGRSLGSRDARPRGATDTTDRNTTDEVERKDEANTPVSNPEPEAEPEPEPEPTASTTAFAPPMSAPSPRAKSNGSGDSRIKRERSAAGADRSEEATPAALFTRANTLRRVGQNSEALGLYQAIIDKFPSAPEAPLSRLALAKLLAGSNPARALVHYQVLASHTGPLRAEGLWGVAEAARLLGQTAVEQRALGELIREFPSSPYAVVARERIQNGHP